MIINLKPNGFLEVVPSRVAEPNNSVLVSYKFEPNTEHLLPVLIINRYEYEGNDIEINSELPIDTGDFEMAVHLLDGKRNIVRKYQGVIPYHPYIVFGFKGEQPTFDSEIKSLRAEKKLLELEIIRLNELGGII